jgi:hypothetical protein
MNLHVVRPYEVGFLPELVLQLYTRNTIDPDEQFLSSELL